MQDVRSNKAPNSRLITVELFGQPYTFKTEVEESRAKEIADFFIREVNKVEDQLSKAKKNVTKQTILILAALNIASENLELQRRYSNFLQNISERTTSLIQVLDADSQ